MDKNCIFCSIIKGDIESKKILENDKLIVINDIEPKAELHFLIIPKYHIENLIDLDYEKYPEIGSEIFKAAQEINNKINNKNGFKILINNGYEAGQRVFHLHAHFLSKLQENVNL